MQTSLLTCARYHPQYLILASQKSHREGRTFSFSILSHFSKKVEKCAFNILFTLNLIFTNPLVLAPILKKLTQSVLPWIENLRGLPNKYIKLKGVLRSTFTIINSIQIAADIDYFVNGKFKNNPSLTILERAAFSMAHLGVSLAWLGQIGFINLVNIAVKIKDLRIFSCFPNLLRAIPMLRDFFYLQRLAQTLGGIRVFSMNKIPFISLVEAAWAMGYACCALEALSKLLQKESYLQKPLFGIKLAKNAAEFTLACLLLQGIIHLTPLGILGSLCIGLEISELIYSEHYDRHQ